jgi:hypothetical protein
MATDLEKEVLAKGIMPRRIIRSGYLGNIPYRAQIEVLCEKHPEKVLEYPLDPKAPAIEVDPRKPTNS